VAVFAAISWEKVSYLYRWLPKRHIQQRGRAAHSAFEEASPDALCLVYRRHASEVRSSIGDGVHW